MGQRIIPAKKFFVKLENDLSFLLSLAWLLGAGNLTGANIGHSRRILLSPFHCRRARSLVALALFRGGGPYRSLNSRICAGTKPNRFCAIA
jgi:hypothetical protein